MTRDEILNMEAGRELDALVAEKLMGLNIKMVTDNDFIFMQRCFYEPLGTGEYYIDIGKTSVVDPVPHYSTDIAAAWEVVEKLYCDGKARDYLSGLYAQGVVDLDKMVHHSPDVDCRAALLAVMEED